MICRIIHTGLFIQTLYSLGSKRNSGLGRAPTESFVNEREGAIRFFGSQKGHKKPDFFLKSISLVTYT